MLETFYSFFVGKMNVKAVYKDSYYWELMENAMKKT
ncbi:hypothetical protein HNP37_002662 [Flavobacterium nitrogenifigens]|uniref:Uncharacterized protein n=2 Tax=Flavobacterium TaxID=237 RepID=A0A7W7IYR0_9FLAO|nr:hypothetical protein [Flavobacterium nitrogenifigens]MBB6387545.1 hypothetical protein [Flavobacterium notoginsengisoli]